MAASGLGSNISKWLAAPVRKTMMSDLGFLRLPVEDGSWPCAAGHRSESDAEQSGIPDLQQLAASDANGVPVRGSLIHR